MPRVALLTDSTADFPTGEAERLAVHVVPLTLEVEGAVYQDGGDIVHEENTRDRALSVMRPLDLYESMRQGALPRTSQATPEQFAAHYENLLQDHDAVLCFPVSSTFSGTYASAVTAARELGSRVCVVDTLGLAGLLYGALRQARAWLEAGVPHPRVAQELHGYASGQFLQLAPQDLRWLIAGGRVGRLAGAAANLLNIKPVLAIQDGAVKPITKVRGFGAAVRTIARNVPDGTEVLILHADHDDCAAELERQLRQRDLTVLGRSLVGSVLGVHAGPGAIGAVALPPVTPAPTTTSPAGR